MPNIPKQFIIATLDDAKLHPIFSDTITYLGKTASVGLKVPFYIVLNYSGAVTLEPDSPLWLMGEDSEDKLILGKSTQEMLNKHSVSISDSTMFIPLCFYTDMEGEYICKMRVDDWTFNLGIEAVGENEMLKINLLNKGVEIPNGISRALATTNLEQANPDFAVLNKKWKELLVNYMEIMAGKGNSKQISNSLEWFGYGKDIELREVWKVDTLDGPRFFDHKFTPVVDYEVKELMRNAAKTTYLTIRHIPDAKHDHSPNQSFLNKFNEPWQWSKEIMRSKMCLLGNFYETFFLPIHINILHSVVEDIYRGNLTNEIAESHATLIENVHSPYELATVEATASAFRELEGFTKLVGHDLPFAEKGGFATTEEVDKLTGIDPESYLYLYNGPGALVDVKMIIPARYKDTNPFKNADLKLTTDLSGEVEVIYQAVDKEGAEYSFRLYARKSGTYTITIECVGESGRVYIGSTKVNIPDTSQVNIGFYKFVYDQSLFNASMPVIGAMTKEDVDRLKANEHMDELVKKYMLEPGNAPAFSLHRDEEQLYMAYPYENGDEKVHSYQIQNDFKLHQEYGQFTGICQVYHWVLDDPSEFGISEQLMGSGNHTYWIRCKEYGNQYSVMFIFSPTWTTEEIETELDDYPPVHKKYSKEYRFLPCIHRMEKVQSNDAVDVTRFLMVVIPTITFEMGQKHEILVYSNLLDDRAAWTFKKATGTKFATIKKTRCPFMPMYNLGQTITEYSWSWSDKIRTVVHRSPRLFLGDLNAL